MLIGVLHVGVSCRFSYSIVSFFLYASCNGSNTSVREERAIFSVIMWFLFGAFSSSSWCFGKGALFYCATPGIFHIIILFSI